MTSIGNDINFDEIFSRQLEAIGKPGDVLFAISTSGKSKNILKAINYAHKKKIRIIFLTSKKFKAKMKDVVTIKVPADRVDRIQEMHICIGHIFCEEIENFLSKIANTRIKQAVILCGGFGTRIKHLTNNIPKPLLRF